MHDLRIECKKLRYLMEFFASLYPVEALSLLIKQLKKLQNNLGDFNDYCVQEDYLLTMAAELPAATAADRRALLAVGALVATIHEKRVRVKAEFADTFEAFIAPENRQLFQRLFRGPEKGKN